jgi:DNA helicase HerA-like ATPase
VGSVKKGGWLTPSADGRTPAAILSVAHLDDEERSLVLGVVLEEVLSYVRSLRGSKRLRALIVFDEVYGFLPPHPANPPTKRPLVALMKQARAFGVGVVIATQNPMDLDYRALGNAGLWCIGRLQTDADRARVLEGLAGANGAPGAGSFEELAPITKNLAPRWFFARRALLDRHRPHAAALVLVVPARADDGRRDPARAGGEGIGGYGTEALPAVGP